VEGGKGREGKGVGGKEGESGGRADSLPKTCSYAAENYV